MREITSSFTTEKYDGSADYTKSKDAYHGNMEAVEPTEPLPESTRPRKDGPGGE